MRDLFKANDSLLDLIVGIVAFGALVELIAIWFVSDKIQFSVGLAFGVVIAIFMAIHMAYTLDRSLDLDEGTAMKKMQSGSFFRYGIVVCLVMLMTYFKVGNPLAAFAGIMGMKVSAYLAPFTHKIIRR